MVLVLKTQHREQNKRRKSVCCPVHPYVKHNQNKTYNFVSVRCLENLKDTHFASASLRDLRKRCVLFHQRLYFQNKNKIFPYLKIVFLFHLIFVQIDIQSLLHMTQQLNLMLLSLISSTTSKTVRLYDFTVLSWECSSIVWQSQSFSR